jgi:hypothetical protein
VGRREEARASPGMRGEEARMAAESPSLSPWREREQGEEWCERVGCVGAGRRVYRAVAEPPRPRGCDGPGRGEALPKVEWKPRASLPRLAALVGLEVPVC